MDRQLAAAIAVVAAATGIDDASNLQLKRQRDFYCFNHGDVLFIILCYITMLYI